MNDDEDLELQALQRRLDDAFQTTRPRAGFEDELWSKMQARRPVWVRVHDFLGGLVSTIRQVPAVPAAAVAVVMVVALGIGIIARSGIHVGGGAPSSSEFTSTSLGASRSAGTFGRLPLPAAVSVPPKIANPPYDAAAPSSAGSYAGPVNLVWAGQFTSKVTSAPVYRYHEPSSADANQFAASLGASPQQGQAGVGILGLYFGDGFTLEVLSSQRSPVREPFYVILPNGSKLPPPGPSPADTANAFLAAHGLLPTWPFVVAIEQSGDATRVNYERQFAIPGYGLAHLVDGNAQRYGLDVDLHGSQSLQASGPLPISLDTATYPIISADQAVRSALGTSPNRSASNVPTVRLTNVELAYALAIAGDHSFFEPVFVFSGTFTQNGVAYVKRVIVPAVGP